MPASVERAVRAAAERGIELVAGFNRWRRRATDHPFLVGVHRPVPAEYTLFDLPVTGRIPPGLAGRYLKMGANPVRPDPTSHWFLGDGMVHGIALRDGRAAWYRNRWILSRSAAAHSGATRRPARGGAATTPSTPTSLASAAARSRWWRPAASPWSCRRTWKHSATTRSRAR